MPLPVCFVERIVERKAGRLTLRSSSSGPGGRFSALFPLPRPADFAGSWALRLVSSGSCYPPRPRSLSCCSRKENREIAQRILLFRCHDCCTGPPRAPPKPEITPVPAPQLTPPQVSLVGRSPAPLAVASRFCARVCLSWWLRS